MKESLPDISRLVALLVVVAIVYLLALAALVRWRRRVARQRNAPYYHQALPAAETPVNVLAELIPAPEVTADLRARAAMARILQAERASAIRAAHSPSARRRAARLSRTRPSPPAMLFMLAALAGLVCLPLAVYRAGQEPYELETVEVVLPLPQMAGRQPVTIVQFSDLHSDGRNRVEPLLAPAIERLAPDLIVFTGDIMNALSRSRTEKMVDPLADQYVHDGPKVADNATRQQSAYRALWDIARLRPQASFACLGNRDGSTWYQDAETGRYGEILARPGQLNGEGSAYHPERRLTRPITLEEESRIPGIGHPGQDFRLLVGEAVRWSREDGLSVWLAGGGIQTAPENEIQMALDNLDRQHQPGDIGILLGHYPSMRHRAERSGKVDLHLAGDTHNGEVALPLLGALVRKTVEDGIFYANALYRFHDARGDHATHLYVNRGIGMDDAWGLSWRLFNRPEITVIRLVDPGSEEASRATPWRDRP